VISVDFPVRVIYADTDMMGRVYYSRFYEYFEAARSHMLREMGLPYLEVEKSGTFLPVLQSHCEHKSSATFDDILTIRTIIQTMPTARFRIDYKVFKEAKAEIVAEGYTVHAFINRDGHPVRPPKIILDVLKAHWNDDE
jgi:acyl-CoA thioester hydrolase|tara:strand:+ start:134 stop:550 length:417 start_codon:yes stop_codon:yes gene_type:complete